MTLSVRRTFAVTLLFFAASVLASAALYAGAELGTANEFLRGVDDWGRLTGVLAINATIAGLAVDLFRIILSRLWPDGSQRPAGPGYRPQPRAESSPTK